MTIFLILLVFVSIAAGLAWYFISHDSGEKEPVGALWLAFGLGFVGAIAAALFENFFVSQKALTAGSGSPEGNILVAALAVGIIEESCKFLPLAFFIYKKRYFNEHTDGVIYFALAGLGFGLPENILYTIQFGAGAGLGRIFLTPFFHAATTGMVGYFLIKTKLAKKSPWRMAVPLGAAMLLHGFYDFGLISGQVLLSLISIVITLSLSTMLFVFYAKATKLDQGYGLSAVGHNRFCRTCGQPNMRHTLYCSRCGAYA